MDNDERMPFMGWAILIIIGSVVLCFGMFVYSTISETNANFDKQSIGYDDGYTHHNKSMYEYSKDYMKLGSNLTQYHYCKGYYDGYNKWYLESTKPEGMKY